MRFLTSLAVFCCCLAVSARAEPLDFVVLGDMPYGADQARSLKFIGKNIRTAGFPFVIHYGDIKAGKASCSDDFLSERRKLLLEHLGDDLFYTPGDNDWTDCDREKAGGFDELNKLDLLRSLFFSGDLPQNPDWGVERQEPDYPENAHWVLGDLLFVTLHIVGTDNGRQEIEATEPEEKALDAVDARDGANLSWLDAAFDRAAGEESTGLVVVIHADPGDFKHRKHEKRRNRPCTAEKRRKCNPYLPFLQKLTERADLFDRPVLLVHGSTNNFCIDEGFGGWRAPKLWRLNGPGDHAAIDAAGVRFDPQDPVPFRSRGLATGDPVPPCSLKERVE